MAKSIKGNNTKESIKRAATGIFYEKGYIKTKVSDICKKSNTAPGMFTYHFESKEQLAVSIYRDFTFQLNEIIDEQLKIFFPKLDELIYEAVTYRAFFIAHAQNSGIRQFYTEICNTEYFIKTNKEMDELFIKRLISAKVPNEVNDPLVEENLQEILTLVNYMEIGYTSEMFVQELSHEELNNKIDFFLLYYYRFFFCDNDFIINAIKESRAICEKIKFNINFDKNMRLMLCIEA